MNCPKCKSEDFYYMWHGEQIGKFCAKCDAYIKWVKKSEIDLTLVKNKPKNKPLF